MSLVNLADSNIPILGDIKPRIRETPKKTIIRLKEWIEVNSKEISSLNKTINNYQSTMLARDKQDKLLKQTIKDINKKYVDAEEMYEELLTRFIKLSDENEQRKQASNVKKPIVTKFRIFGICILTKTSI